jgi:hypothetical protein
VIFRVFEQCVSQTIDSQWQKKRSAPARGGLFGFLGRLAIAEKNFDCRGSFAYGLASFAFSFSIQHCQFISFHLGGQW